MIRLVLRGQPFSPGPVRVAHPAARHAVVARAVAGEPIELLNLAGEVAEGRLLRWEGRACWVDVERVERGRGEPPAPLVLALAVLHTSAFDWAVEKATELGVTAIVPVLTARVQGRRHEARVLRWQRLADAAVVQCGRCRAPQIERPRPLEALVTGATGQRWIADESSPPAAVAPAPAGCPVTVLVGPEGGFTPDELRLALAASFVGLPLGNRTLRAETAAVAALVLAQSRAGWL